MRPSNEDWATSETIKIAIETIKASENGLNEVDLCNFMEYVFQYLKTGKLPENK